jgi:hypothetical protein
MSSSREGIEAPRAAAPGGLVARFRQRLFPAVSPDRDADHRLPLPAKQRISFNAGIAEFLLINRLRARSARKAQAAEMLERATRIVFVTCRNWFSTPDGKNPPSRTPL